jgi:nucleoside-diphosphate-sugar epimerase
VTDAVDHVVLGAGAVGMAIIEALVRRGESVRVVNRSGLRGPMTGVHSATGDVTHPAFAAFATRHARVTYQALNPPPLGAAVLQTAAITAGERAGDAHTHKRRVRAAMARDLMTGHSAGHVRS